MTAALVALTASLAAAAPAGDELQRRYRRATALVQHVAGEYAEAIEEGERNEVKGQVSLVEIAAGALKGTDAEGEKLAARLTALAKQMPDAASAQKSLTALERIIPQLTRAGRLTTHPAAMPDLARGEKLYRTSCYACHGVLEDPQPRIAQFMYPMPASFLRADIMVGLSPYKAFNIMSEGIPETTMPSFELLPEADRWAIAFYLFTQRQPPCEGAAPKVSLEALSTLTDGDILQKYGENKLGCLRSPTAGVGLPSLPSPFNGLTWTTDLRARFFSAHVEPVDYRGADGRPMQTVTASGIELPLFGDARVELSGVKGQLASVLTLTTTDRRHTCAAEAPPAPDCRNVYGKHLETVFTRLETALIQSLGTPERGPPAGQAHGLAPDAREKTRLWKLPGARIELSLGREEADGWRVALTAVRL